MNEFSVTESEGGFEWADTLYKWFYRGKMLLKKYWWIILLTSAAGLAWQTWQEMKKAPMYTSYARLIVKGRIAIPEGSIYREELANFFGTQIAIMKSAMVTEKAANRVKIQHPDLSAVPVYLEAHQQPETTIFRLSARGAEPKFTRAYLDACLKEYINFRENTRRVFGDETMLKLSEQLVDLENKIDTQENEIVDFQKLNNLVYMQEHGSSAGTYLAQLKNNMADLTTQLRILNSLDINQDYAGDINNINLNQLKDLTNFPAVANYHDTQAKLEKLKAEKEEFSIYMKPRHPRIIGLSQEIERFSNMLRIYHSQVIRQIAEQKKSVQSQMNNIESEIKEWENTALDYSRRIAEFDRMKSRLERQKNQYDQLLSAYQSIKVGQNVQQETIQVFEPATPAYKDTKQIPGKMMAGGVSGFAVGCVIVFLLGMIDNRLISAEDITQRFEQPVIGVIPMQKAAKGKVGVELLKPKDDRHLFAESCRTLRSSLLFMDKDGGQVKTIVITSAVPSEGKSTIASNLAVTLAFASSRILLIDADMRRGALYKIMNRPRKPGLAEYIQGKCNLDSVINSTDLEDLDFISTGEYPDRPGELLLSERMDNLLTEVKNRYDYVVFDSAPILAADDTTSFAAKADIVLFAVRSTYTQVRQVKAAVERLKLRRANIKGFILNYVDTKGSDYYYYNKYHDYYVYDKSDTPT